MAIEKANAVAAGLGSTRGMTASIGRGFIYEPMDYFAPEFYDWKDDIVICESQILKVGYPLIMFRLALVDDCSSALALMRLYKIHMEALLIIFKCYA